MQIYENLLFKNLNLEKNFLYQAVNEKLNKKKRREREREREKGTPFSMNLCLSSILYEKHMLKKFILKNVMTFNFQQKPSNLIPYIDFRVVITQEMGLI